MKRSVFILVFTIFAAFAAPAQVNVGMTDTASYYLMEICACWMDICRPTSSLTGFVK